MNGEAHQVGSPVADILPPLSIHHADKTPMGGNVEDRGIVRIDGEAVDVMKLIYRSEARRCRKTGAA
jgi:hypothetical protein